MRHTLPFILFCLVLIVTSFTARAQVQSQVPNQVGGQVNPGAAVGPPVVNVTEVKFVGVSGNNLRFRVKWNAQVPTTTQVQGFRVFLTLNFNSGAPANLNQAVAASAREAILQTPNRGVGNAPKSFTAFVESSFTTIVTQSQEFSGNFSLSKINAFVDTSGSQSTRPTNSTGVTKVATPSQSKLGEFTVNWGFRENDQRQGLNEIRFDVTGNFSYIVGGTPSTTINRTATQSVGAGGRQVQFSFPGTPKLQPGQSVQRIDAAITVKAIFSITQRQESAPLAGNF